MKKMSFLMAGLFACLIVTAQEDSAVKKLIIL